MWSSLINTVKSWFSPPKPAPRPSGPSPIPVTTYSGMQGSTYNPQRTAPATYYQPATYNPQRTAPTAYYQPARTTQYIQPAYRAAPPTYAVAAAQRAAQVVAAQQAAAYRAAQAERARQEAIRQEAIRRELERQRIIKVKTAEHQGRLSVYSNKFRGSVTAAKARDQLLAFGKRKGHWTEYFSADGKLWGGKKYDEKAAPQKVRAAYDQMRKFMSLEGGIEENDLNELANASRSKYRLTAQQLIQQRKKGSIFDEIAGRQSAQKGLADLQNNIGDYEKRLKSFKSKEATLRQKYLEAQTAGNVAEQNRLAEEFNTWYAKEVRTLVRSGAAYEGLSEGYGKQANAAYKSRFGGFLNTANGIAKTVGKVAGKVYQYTLGQGDKNIPSAITVLERGYNLARNANGNSGKSINFHDSSRVEPVSKGSLLERWQQTYNQRAGNIVHPENFVPGVTKKPKGMTDKEWKLQQSLLANTGTNYLSEFGVSAATGGGLRIIGKLFGKGAKATSSATKRTDLYKNFMASRPGKAAKWLGQEYKTPARAAGDKIQKQLTPLFTSAKIQAGSIKRSFDTWKTNQQRFNVTAKTERKDYAAALQKKFGGMDERVVYLAQNLVRQQQLGKSYKQMAWLAQKPVKYSARGLPKLLRGEFPTVRMKGLTKEQYKQAIELRNFLTQTSGGLYAKERSKGELMKRWYQKRGLYNRDTAKGLRYRRQEGYIANKSFGGAGKKNPDEAPDYRIPFLIKSKGGRFQDPARLSKSLANRYYQSRRWEKQYIDNPKFFHAMAQKSEKFKANSNKIDDIKRENVPTLKNLASNVVRGTGRWDKKSRIDKLGFTGNALKQDILPLPRRVWTAATLPLRPAWYANNAAYNEIAGALSAGPRFFAEQAKLLKRGALTAARKENPEVVSNISKYHDGGWLYRPAKAIEDNARLAAFNALKKKGMKDGAALKRTNKYLLDYTTKNWERPLKTIMPFWAWSKGITKATAQMPFDRPGAASAINANDELTQRQLDKLPKDQRKFYERGMYIGKDKDGNPRFLNAPWLPFTTANSKNVGANPYLSAADELYTNKDYYGNPLEDKGFLATLKSKFPQYNLWNDFQKYGKTDIKYFSERGSEGFALTKQQTKDNTGKGMKTLKSFFGWNDARSFDWKRHAKNDTQKKFLKEWFDHDWKKEFGSERYDEMVAAQTALAQKYGLDLEKDVYKGIFQKNDTPTTQTIKAKKDFARKWGNEFWNEYKAQPYGTRSRWANEKMKAITASGIVGKNSYIYDKLPKWHSAENAIKYSKPSTAIQYKGKWFKNADSLARYKKYEAYTTSGVWRKGKRFSSEAKANAYDRYLAYTSQGGGVWRNGKRFRSVEKADAYDRYLSYNNGVDRTSTYSRSTKQSPYQADGKFFKTAQSMKKYQEGKFWKEYYDTKDFTERQKLLDKNPQYRTFAMPQTDEEWDIFKSERKKRQFAAASKLPTWAAAYANYKASTPKRVKFSPGKKIAYKLR